MIPVKPKDVTWTTEQWEAIYDDNKNIIVSAGAGSGKTAVLTERVLRKLKDGVHINELLVLTFTKAAANEMADRIRKKIKKIEELEGELSLLDSSYITTFDSFSLAILKKYHYLINISKDISVIDSGIIMLEKSRIMDVLFLELYDKKDSNFMNMIKNFCLKDDSDIRNYVINISNKLDLLSNKEEYLNNYFNNYYTDDKISDDIDKYLSLIDKKISLIKNIVSDISFINSDFSIKLDKELSLIYNYSNYDDLVTRLNVNMPRVPNGSSDELKDLKSRISDIVKEIKALCCYSSVNDIRDTINMTRDTVKVIIDIILEFSKRVSVFKKENNYYEFHDIAIMAINILKEYKDVREEIADSFKEIMIDEYQDTNDLQEEFISLISRNNVYMVGDIKQSIYRFRNANPYIFKNKYDSYSVSNVDRKIDLNKNFRSREEVIDNINKIFNLVMDDDFGGADYLSSHQMIFGNNVYNNKSNQDYNMDIYSYDYDKSISYSREEIEAFIIAKDIVEKYNNKYQILDKDSNSLRDVKYSDFALILDRASNFDLYKKIFSYFGIPVSLYKSYEMNDNDDFNVIRNIIRFIIKIKDKEYDTLFKYLFISIMRSFLFDASDEEIFDYFVNSNFKDSVLYKKCLDISKKIDYSTISEILDLIVDSFSYYECLITIGNISNNIIKLDKIYDLGTNLEKMGYDLRDFSSYLVDISNNDYSMEYDVSSLGSDSVKIMTIHKSKGLEYSICYFSGLYKKFNISDLKEKFIYDKDYGIVIPYYLDNIEETIYKELVRDKYLRDEISEKIRLLYVALTRAREKIILVKPYSDSVNVNKSDYRSFDDIFNSIFSAIDSYYKNINIDELGLSNDYKMIKVGNYKDSIVKSDVSFDVKELKIDNSILESSKYSKVIYNAISKDDYNNLELGIKLHKIFEYIDLKNPNYDVIDNSFYRDVVRDFLSQDIVKDIDKAIIYKEYEFIYYEDNNKYHGIIDLMLEYDDHIDIIDYKLKDTTDSNYIKQLNGYKDYISSKVDKDVNIYLYSLLDKRVVNIK